MAFTVAIDGPAASGKGTVAREIAARYGFAHLDTGLLYRAVGRLVLAGAEPVDAARSLARADLDRDDLRDAEAAQAASRIAVIPEVRSALLDFQRAFARRDGGAVLDGRDIGTVICPDAEVKLFITASDEVRATRRFEELRTGGAETALTAVLADLRQRDARDRARDTAPLKPARDALLIDTTSMTIEQAVSVAAAAIDRIRNA
jgi:cytidylate kinase